MRNFHDANTTSWAISLTFDSLRRVKQQTGHDLTAPLLGQPALLTRLQTEPLLVCEVLAALVEPQMAEKSITPEQFARGLSGAAMAAAQTALLEELLDFSRSLGRKAEADAMEISNTLALEALRRETGLTLELGRDRMQRWISAAQARAEAEAERLMSGNSAGDWRGSSESPLAPIPCENLPGWPTDDSARIGITPPSSSPSSPTSTEENTSAG